MIEFKTKSGSTYQVLPYGEDLEDNMRQIRRLNGKFRPTQRQGEDGKWCSYMALYPEVPEVGKSVMIHWKMNEDGSMNCTVTSPVAEVDLNAKLED